jgi:hypothetical protein
VSAGVASAEEVAGAAAAELECRNHRYKSD